MNALRVDAVEVRLVDLELVRPTRTATGWHRLRPVVLVRVRTELGDGVGECSALAAPDYTAEYADGAAAVLVAHLLPRLLADGGRLEAAAPRPGDPPGDPLPLARAALRRMAGVRGHPMAKAAVEMAVADLECRLAGRSLAEALGAPAPRVTAGATIGIGEADEVARAVAEATEAGYRRLKLKIAPGSEAVAAAVRRQAPAVELAADANGSYLLEGHRRELAVLDSLGLALLEQPLAADALAASAELRRRLRTTVALDESVADRALLAAALRLGAAGAVSIKPGRCGGLTAASAAVEACAAAGVPCLVGGMFEAGIGRAAALAVAALPGVTLAGDLGASDRYFATDLTLPHVIGSDGMLAVPAGPGLGVTLLEEAPGRLVAGVRPGQA